MAYNFSANQYDTAFRPTKLCNWEIPRKCVAAPKTRDNVTKIIVNDRGHLLQRAAMKNLSPWTNTCKRTCLCSEKRNLGKEMDSKMKRAADIMTTWERRSSHVPVFNQDLVTVCDDVKKESVDRKKSEANDNPVEKIEQSTSSNESKNEHESEKQLLNFMSIPASNTTSTVEPVLSNAYSNDILAKNLRNHDRKHHSLADAVENRSFAASQMKGEHFPGLSLNVDADTTAVGCKIYQSPGPTQCSKLKVFRPKTATNVDDKENEHVQPRPKTTSSIQKRVKPLREMDLAIYWDVSDGREISSPLMPTREPKMNMETPENAKASSLSLRDTEHSEAEHEIRILKASEERNEHSNGGFLDPASDEKADIQQPVMNSKALVPITLSTDGNKVKKKFCRSISSNSIKRESEEGSPQASCNKYSSKQSQKSPEVNKSGITGQRTRNEKCYQSAPDLRNLTTNLTSKTAVKCRRVEIPERAKKIESSSYKLAFKAGKLNNFNVNEELFKRIEKSKNLRIPKPRTPFVKKSYAIRSLIPPFSIWPQVTGYDYPDHWRLVSIYQHSYKPLDARKRPLMKTVFQ